MPLSALLLLQACEGRRAGDPAGGDARPRIVSTIFPVTDLVRRVGGGSVEVTTLLPPGASPDLYQPTPRTMRELSSATLYVEVGAGLDPWARAVLEGGRGPPADRIVTLTDGVELLRGTEGSPGGNPHVWLDPVLVRDRLVPRIADAIVALVPESEPEIRERARALADTLGRLDREVRELLEELPSRAFVATHPAWSYFADRYDLREVGVLHPHPGARPSSRTLSALVEEARRAGVRVVFAEPQLGEAAARALASELGVPVRILDPLGGPGSEGRDSYPALIRYNARAIARGLEGRAP